MGKIETMSEEEWDDEFKSAGEEWDDEGNSETTSVGEWDEEFTLTENNAVACLLYTSDAADE